MVTYLMEISYLKCPLFSILTKFQQCMFKRIHWVLTSPNGPAKFPHNKCLDVEVHCVLIEYENQKAKLVHFLIQLIDLEEPNDQRQELFSEREEVVGEQLKFTTFIMKCVQ